MLYKVKAKEQEITSGRVKSPSYDSKERPSWLKVFRPSQGCQIGRGHRDTLATLHSRIDVKPAQGRRGGCGRSARHYRSHDVRITGCHGDGSAFRVQLRYQTQRPSRTNVMVSFTSCGRVSNRLHQYYLSIVSITIRPVLVP